MLIFMIFVPLYYVNGTKGYFQLLLCEAPKRAVYRVNKTSPQSSLHFRGNVNSQVNWLSCVAFVNFLSLFLASIVTGIHFVYTPIALADVHPRLFGAMVVNQNKCVVAVCLKFFFL